MRAESAGHGELEVLLRDTSTAHERYLTKGESQWRARLQMALQQGIFTLGGNERQLQDEVWHEASLMVRGQPDEDGADGAATPELLTTFHVMTGATRVGPSRACGLRPHGL